MKPINDGLAMVVGIMIVTIMIVLILIVIGLVPIYVFPDVHAYHFNQ